jgi:hypothetical protein
MQLMIINMNISLRFIKDNLNYKLWANKCLLFNIKRALFQQFHGENKSVGPLLQKMCYLTERTLINMSLHSDTFSWFRPNPSILLLFNVAFFVKKQHIPIYFSLVWHNLNSNPWSIALKARTMTIATIMTWLTVTEYLSQMTTDMLHFS